MNRELELLEKLEKELNLKELQIKSLLTITQAINENVKAEGLYNMYKSFLSWEMGINKMGLFIPEEGAWECAAEINLDPAHAAEIIPLLSDYKRLHTIKDDESLALKEFDIIIPVFHKKEPIAFSVIGGIKDREDLYNKIQFITTITNIIAVAIENKRLFKQQIEQEALRKEMEVASNVQKMLIPDSLPVNDQYELSSIYRPHSNVGGDYFDYIKFSDKRFAFCIADISGKGVAAALLMANFQAIIQSLIYQYRDLETFVFALNQSVVRITKSDKFITFFIAEVDLDAKTLKYINAGHYPPVLKMGNELKELDKGCTVIGAFDQLPDIQEESIPITDECMILAFTDGLAELRDKDGVFFESDRIKDFITKNSPKSADEFNESLLTEINNFKGEQEYSDDIAVITCKIYN
jgi:sigma-B regulation protein RsbU (phosphoserine phosphatase)